MADSQKYKPQKFALDLVSSRNKLPSQTNTKSSIEKITTPQDILSDIPASIKEIDQSIYCRPKVVPFYFQLEVLQETLNLYRAALDMRQKYPLGIYNASDQGTGKTLEAIFTINLFNQYTKRAGNLKTLVVVPASLRWNWESEIRKFSTLAPVTIRTIYKQKDCFPQLGADYVITSYDMLRNPTVCKQLQKQKWDFLIVDEMQNCTNLFAKRTKLVMYFYTQARFSMFLSGTPIRKSALDLYPALRCLEHNADPFSLPVTQDLYIKKFCKIKRIKVKNRIIVDPYGVKNEEGLVELMEPYFIRKSKENHLPGLPDKIFQQIELNVELPEGVTESKITDEEIKKLLGELKTACDKNDEEKIKYILQKNKNFALIRKELAINKVLGEGGDFIEDLLADNIQLTIFCWHRDVITLLESRLKKSGYTFETIHGGIEQKKRKLCIDRFTSKKVQCLIAQIQVGGVGLNLQETCNTCCFLESSFSPSDIMQAIDRLHRIGQRFKVTAYFLSGKNRFDSKVNSILVQKLKTIQKLIKDT